jgi:hypothetical protein
MLHPYSGNKYADRENYGKKKKIEREFSNVLVMDMRHTEKRQHPQEKSEKCLLEKNVTEIHTAITSEKPERRAGKQEKSAERKEENDREKNFIKGF